MFDKNKVKLGIAPIAWTNDDMPDLGKENTFEQCVSEMALAGFTGSECETSGDRGTYFCGIWRQLSWIVSASDNDQFLCQRNCSSKY